MAKLRHIAITVSDLAKGADFYEKVFELKRVRSIPGILEALTDGVINITLLKYETDEMAGDERGKDFYGLHHVGFIVDDLDKTAQVIEEKGGRFHKAATPEMQAENKYRTPDGVVFDIARPEHLWTGAKL
jgi:catechol 2,3-dioxygenase-like lactoylglutathione lyase family enzyme